MISLIDKAVKIVVFMVNAIEKVMFHVFKGTEPPVTEPCSFNQSYIPQQPPTEVQTPTPVYKKKYTYFVKARRWSKVVRSSSLTDAVNFANNEAMNDGDTGKAYESNSYELDVDFEVISKQMDKLKEEEEEELLYAMSDEEDEIKAEYQNRMSELVESYRKK